MTAYSKNADTFNSFEMKSIGPAIQSILQIMFI